APYTAERIGMLAMLCVVVVFGVHSLADWTWYVPGNACVALLCAGWLAGRGPLGAAAAGAAPAGSWRTVALDAGAGSSAAASAALGVPHAADGAGPEGRASAGAGLPR